MSDTAEPRDAHPEAPREREKVGDILRKERVTRRITVETVAKDLKLNVSYIKAIEENDYDNLPADPYVRVYLRSIATYLMLDPEEILRKFFEDKGVKQVTYEEERSTRITISMKQKDKPRMPWIIIGIVIAVLVIIGYIANKAGLVSPATGSAKQAKETQAPAGEEMLFDSTDGARPVENAGGDSTDIAPSLQKPDKEVKEADVKKTSEAPAAKDSMRLTLSAIKDSVWVHIFSDGQSWRNFIYPKSPRVFAAVDSFNVHVGHNQLMRYALNGKPIKIKSKGVVIFKLDRTGHKIWKHAKWFKTFKNRT